MSRYENPQGVFYREVSIRRVRGGIPVFQKVELVGAVQNA